MKKITILSLLLLALAAYSNVVFAEGVDTETVAIEESEELIRPASALMAQAYSIGGYSLTAGRARTFRRGFRTNTRIYLKQTSGSAYLTGKISGGKGSISCGGSSCYLTGVPAGNPGITSYVDITVHHSGGSVANGGVWHQ